MTVSGAVNEQVFAAYLSQVLGATLRPDEVAMLDNLLARRVAGLAQLSEAHEARLLYLPPCSPDFKPIELTFGKLRIWRRTTQARTREALESVIQAAKKWINEQDVKNWFDYGATMSTNLKFTPKLMIQLSLASKYAFSKRQIFGGGPNAGDIHLCIC